jgi:hypothetical protein
MSISADTRIFKGSILAVRNSTDDAWIETGEMLDVSGFGASAKEIDVQTAASTTDVIVVGLQDTGDAVFNFLLDMDDDFQAEMEVMRDGQETREFTLTFPEGTLNTCTFSAWVMDATIAGPKNDVYKMTLTLTVTSAKAWTTV